MVVKSAIKASIKNVDDNVRPGTPEYDDLMQNIENQVQSVLKEEREINY